MTNTPSRGRAALGRAARHRRGTRRATPVAPRPAALRLAALRTAALCGFAATFLVLQGCDILSVSDRAEEVRVTVTSEQAVDSAVVITASHFIFGFEGDEAIHFTQPDTARVALPFDQVYSLRSTGRFVVRTFVPYERLDPEDPDENPDLSMRILVDGEEVFHESQRMQINGYLQYYVIDL